MKRRIFRFVSNALLVLILLVFPIHSRAQQTTTDQSTRQLGVSSVFGSVFLSLLHIPLKLTTCVGTQAVAAVAYTATFGVPGNYDGRSNSKQIGEIASRSCTGNWFVTPEQVNSDYR